MCFSTLKSTEMLVLALMETEERNTVSPLCCPHGKKLQMRLRATLWLVVLFSSPQLSTLTEYSLEERKGLDFFGGIPDARRDYMLPPFSHRPAVELLPHMLNYCNGKLTFVLKICTSLLLWTLDYSFQILDLMTPSSVRLESLLVSDNFSLCQ